MRMVNKDIMIIKSPKIKIYEYYTKHLHKCNLCFKRELQEELGTEDPKESA